MIKHTDSLTYHNKKYVAFMTIMPYNGYILIKAETLDTRPYPKSFKHLPYNIEL